MNQSKFETVKPFYVKYFQELVEQIESDHTQITSLINFLILQKKYPLGNLTDRRHLQILEHEMTSTFHDKGIEESKTITPMSSSRASGDPQLFKNISNDYYSDMKTAGGCGDHKDIIVLDLYTEYYKHSSLICHDINITITLL